MRVTFHAASVLAAIFATDYFTQAVSVEKVNFGTGRQEFDPASLVPELSMTQIKKLIGSWESRFAQVSAETEVEGVKPDEPTTSDSE